MATARAHSLLKLSKGEPNWNEKVFQDNSELIKAYNTYASLFSADDAKDFVLDYLNFKGYPSDKVSALSKVNSYEFRTAGWNCRILHQNGKLPKEVVSRMVSRFESLVKKVPSKVKENSSPKPKIDISYFVADLDDIIDRVFHGQLDEFDPKVWLSERNVKPSVALALRNYYKPLLDEVILAMNKGDPQVTEAYSIWSEERLEDCFNFLSILVEACEGGSTTPVVTRKPRKKKAKPASVLVKKLNYLIKDEATGFSSLSPETIIGKSQVWVYNAKTRFLGVYHAKDSSGLSVKGSSILNFDENTSISKKLRKPKEILNSVSSEGKVFLRKVLDGIKAKDNALTGRINKDTIIVRAL